MIHLLFSLFFIFINGQKLGKKEDIYEMLINEKVSQQYCNEVINNLTYIIDEAYVYSDFVKAPKQPVGYDNYIPKVDLIKELNDINKNDRTFYDFYRDIKNVLDKTRDGHLMFYADKTPNDLEIVYYYFCIPFKYMTEENFTKVKNNNDDIYLTIEHYEYCEKGFSNETLTKIKKLEGKKITKINNLSPYEYLEEMGKKFDVIHSPQARYIYLISRIHFLFLDYFPFKKEELNTIVEFEGGESLQIEYMFNVYQSENKEYKEFFKAEKRKTKKGLAPIIDINQIELKYKIKKGILSKKEKKSNWDYTADGIKCKVDEENKYNVLYQNTFYPDDYNEYELVMESCFEEFYSNDYKIIIIEDRNSGGYADLCVPFSQYLAPNIPTNRYTAAKQSETNKEVFGYYYQAINPETCMPYTDKDNIMEGEEDKYSEDVIHKKTKIYDYVDVYRKLYMEYYRKSLLSKGSHKKPTEIIVFTDGFSFSCTSLLITELQSHGAAIIVGYNSRPDLQKKYFDASQSNSATFEYPFSESTYNLYNLGYSVSITSEETFDFNDKNNPRTPREFLVNPVDEIAKIYKTYDDEIYDRFIQEANSIFKKYNDLENGECNPDNKYLYYETSDCDSKINIDKAHGGYVCGTDGKWNKNNCIASYCDEGYVLNEQRNKCNKNLCDNISFDVKEIKGIRTYEEFIIEPKTAYYFYINDENNTYYFISNKDYNQFYYDGNYEKKYINNQTLLGNQEFIYVNTYLNISEKHKLYVVNSEHYDDNEIFDYFRKNEGKYTLSAWKYALTMILLILVV